MGGRVRVRMKDEAGQPVSEVLTSSEDTARPQPAHRDYLAECDLCTSRVWPGLEPPLLCASCMSVCLSVCVVQSVFVRLCLLASVCVCLSISLLMCREGGADICE